MPLHYKLLAWVEHHGEDEFLAAFVAKAAARQRIPATQLCSSQAEAHQWVEDEAAVLDVPVEWVSEAPKR
jgi:hypothetical protein